MINIHCLKPKCLSISHYTCLKLGLVLFILNSMFNYQNNKKETDFIINSKLTYRYLSLSCSGI